MKICILVFCVFHFAYSSKDPVSLERKVKSLPIVDAFISGLEREPWSPDDGACLRATLDMLRGVRNNTLWASWMWDSMQLPTGSLYGAQAYLGNYDQCLQAPWYADHPGLRSQYCLLEVRGPLELHTKTFDAFDVTEEYYRTPTADGHVFNQHFFGACLPSSCSPSSVTKISRVLLQLTHLPDGEVFLDPRDCKTAGEEMKYPKRYYVFWSVICVLIVLSIISTLFNNNDANQNALGIIGKSFCMKRNFQSLFSTSPSGVKVLDGLRVLTAVMTIFGHETYFIITTPTINALDINKAMNSPMGKLLSHLDIIVDNFFLMSGLLLVRGLMLSKQNLFYALLKRYIRLMGLLAFIILFMVTVAEYIISGPMANMFMRYEANICEKYWWKNLVMANTDIATSCGGLSWYIGCDFQLAVLGSFLFYLFKQNRKLGVVAFVTVALAATANLGLIVYWKQLAIIPLDYKALVSVRDSESLNDVYFSSQARAGPYLVGMIMGYIITEYNSTQYRNYITECWSSTIVAISAVVACIMLGLGAVFADRPYNPLEAAVVVATNRVIWAIAVSCIIAVCEYGSLTHLPSFLGWKGFVPLSKLSFCLYMIHIIVFFMQKFGLKNPAPVIIYHGVINVLGILVLSGCLSLVLHLILVAPTVNLSNALLSKKSPSEQNAHVLYNNGQNGSVTQNDQNGFKPKSL